MRQLGELGNLLNKQEKERVQILAVSIDSQQASRQLVEKLQERTPGDYNFPFLEDKGHKVIDRYGILNSTGKGWPHPSTYIIDTEGVVRWKFVETNPAKRPSNLQILSEVKKIK